MPTPRQAIEPLLRAGQLPQARAQLESLLAAGGAAEDFALLGLLCGMLNDPAGSERACRRAIELKAEYPEAFANLGIALSAQGRGEEALSAYERAIALNPQNPVTHNNRATALNALGRGSEAEAGYRRAIELKPDYPDAWYNLGNLLSTRGQSEEALECYRSTLVFNPRHVGALNNLGQHHLARKETDRAIELLEQALALAPRHAGTLNNLGNAWLARGDFPRALDFLQKAVQLAPNDPAVLNNLGLAQLAAGNLAEAHRSCEALLRIQPGSVEGWINFGNLHEREDHHGEAERCYRAALARRPDSAEAHFNLGIALHGQGRLDEELASYDEALRLRPDYPDAWTNRLFALNFNPDWSPTAIFAEHRAWGETFGVTRADRGLAIRRALDGRKLRVGYVSPDLREHSVSFFVEPVLRAHDRARFEIFCYAELPPGREDATSARLRALDLHWRDTRGLGDLELARRMREDEIDILVDLAGHTANNRLGAFAYRPAPVQLSWLGYPNTTGLPAMDYRLTDHWADPPGQEVVHTEQLVRITGGFLCFGPPEVSPEVASPPSARAGHVTFGSFNMLPKVTPVAVAAWARILKAVPGSRLLLKNRSMRDPVTQERYAGLFESHGIARERLEFVGWLPRREDHLALYGQVDIALDTFPYNGTTTTCEALWMGVPVIVLEGNRHAARVGVSILSRLGLEELIAPDEEGYVRLAASLAGDRNRLASLRTTMRKRLETSSLCDARAFTAALEGIYMNLMENVSGDPDRPG